MSRQWGKPDRTGRLSSPLHTGIGHLVTAGVDLATVKGIMRHKSIGMTRHCARLARARTEVEVGALEGALLSKEERQANDPKAA